MGPKSKKEYMVEIRTRYHQAKKNEKGSILLLSGSTSLYRLLITKSVDKIFSA